jgi:hypothetical protein
MFEDDVNPYAGYVGKFGWYVVKSVVPDLDAVPYH